MIKIRITPSPPQWGEGRDGGVVLRAFAALTPPTLPSPARGEDLTLRLVEDLEDGFENTFQVGLYFPVPEAKRSESPLFKVFVSSLILFTSRVLAAINFDYQLLFKTNKIWNVRAHGLLAAEGYAQLVALKLLPQQALLQSHIASQSTSQLTKLFIGHTKTNYPKYQQPLQFNPPNRQILPPQRGRVGWGVVLGGTHGTHR